MDGCMPFVSFIKHLLFVFSLFSPPSFNSLTWSYSLSVALSRCLPNLPALIFLKLNHFHFYTCVWWGNYRLLNRACPLKTHTLSRFLPSHSAVVCEIKSIPAATWLPSKSAPTITTTTATQTGGSVKDLSLSSLSLSPSFDPPSFFPSLFSLLKPSQSHLPQHTLVELPSDKRLALWSMGGDW